MPCPQHQNPSCRQWEVVALHHASALAPEQDELGGYVNEGIRISRILRFLKSQQLNPRQRVLLDDLRLERVSEDPAAMRKPPRARTNDEDGRDQLNSSVGGGRSLSV